MPRTARPIGLALAGGGPFGAIYEIGALMALEESLEGIELHRLDTYVGVSAGSFLTAALANGIPLREIHARFIGDERTDGLAPEVFMRPALREYRARIRALPPILARSAWTALRQALSGGPLQALAGLGGAIPTGIFDGDAIHDYLQAAFERPGHTNDFRALRPRLCVVATDLDSGESVSFGRPGRDDVPISKAVQASAALPGLFPPVAIGGRFYVDGALRKTLHASEALDDGARLVLCVNPIVAYDARLAEARGAGRERLAEGGLPLVLSQTLRSILHSRMGVGLKQYRTRYPDADVILFEPDPDDRETFRTQVFSYAMRRQACEHAYRRTRRDLLRRRHELEPIFERHGIGLRLEVLRDPTRCLTPVGRTRPALARLPEAAAELRATMLALRRWMATRAPRSG